MPLTEATEDGAPCCSTYAIDLSLSRAASSPFRLSVDVARCVLRVPSQPSEGVSQQCHTLGIFVFVKKSRVSSFVDVARCKCGVFSLCL
jgi:hypothetical protein